MFVALTALCLIWENPLSTNMVPGVPSNPQKTALKRKKNVVFLVHLYVCFLHFLLVLQQHVARHVAQRSNRTKRQNPNAKGQSDVAIICFQYMLLSSIETRAAAAHSTRGANCKRGTA
jgi:hypothetical protein